MKKYSEKLEPNCLYHIYNRGTDKMTLFRTDKNFQYFLRKYKKFVHPFVDTYAFCIMGNHFHFLVRIKNYHEVDNLLNKNNIGLENVNVKHFFSRKFGNLFNCYAQSFNKENSRTGSLFESPFRRIKVNSDKYFIHLIKYIHLNPEKHQSFTNYKYYPYSSYPEITSKKRSIVNKLEVIDWFGNIENFKNFHETDSPVTQIISYLIE